MTKNVRWFATVFDRWHVLGIKEYDIPVLLIDTHEKAIAVMDQIMESYLKELGWESNDDVFIHVGVDVPTDEEIWSFASRQQLTNKQGES